MNYFPNRNFYTKGKPNGPGLCRKRVVKLNKE